jgi:alkylresorcinol/alkylpyrone synthase
MSARILSLATAVPAQRLDGDEALRMVGQLWPRTKQVAASESPSTRNIAADLGSLMEPAALGRRMEEYQRHALELGERAAALALQTAGLDGSEIDAVISVSCTGYMVPSLETRLHPRLGLRPDCLHLPITELGCSGGAAALGFALRHLTGFPGDRVLVIAVELPSLTFQPGDRSIANLTASMVFGDGAAAAVLSGDSGPGLHVLAAGSHLVAGTTEALGFDLRDGGFHVVLDRRLPGLVAATLGDAVHAFVARNGISEIGFAAVHAGGPRIMDAVQDALGLESTQLSTSRRVFDRQGNASSVSILMVLEELARELPSRPLEGLGIGIGPGVAIELLHLQWCPPPTES